MKLWPFSCMCLVLSWPPPSCLPAFQCGAHCWNSLSFSHPANVLTLFTEMVLWPVHLVWIFFFFQFLAVLGLCCAQAFPNCNEQELLSSRGAWASLVAEHRLSSVAHRLGCPKACGILPDQGWNLCPQHRQAVMDFCEGSVPPHCSYLICGEGQASHRQ